MGGIHYWRAPFTPLLSSVVVIRVSSMYLRSLPSSVLSLSTVSASMLPCLFCHQRTHIHSHALLSSSSWFLIFSERRRMSSEGEESPCMAACINICTLIWPCLSSSIHPDIDWFSQQVSLPIIWQMGGVHEGGCIEPAVVGGCLTCH